MAQRAQITTVLFGFLIVLSGTAGCVGNNISAQRYDSAQECWGPREVVGEESGPSGCDGESVFATDSSGNYWRFSSSCIADGFEQVDDVDLKAELGGAPSCED